MPSTRQRRPGEYRYFSPLREEEESGTVLALAGRLRRRSKVRVTSCGITCSASPYVTTTTAYVNGLVSWMSGKRRDDTALNHTDAQNPITKFVTEKARSD